MAESIWTLLTGDLENALVHNGDILNEARPSLKRRINVCLTPCMLVCFLHRLAHAAWESGLTRLAGLLAYINLLIHRIDIHPACDIKGGLYIPHPAGVLIRTHAGRNFVVLAGAGICDDDRSAPQKWPTVGDEVWLAAGARVSGRLTIGDNARVSPRAVLVTDLPASTIAHAPQQGVIN
ncbi:MAG: serine O-acetyltransferase [Gammaproteobacteria bacterium]